MVYPSDGRNHHSGVLNEKTVVDYLTEHHKTLFGENITFMQRGGTSTVDDIDVLRDGNKLTSISVKNHSGGTFDYINTRKLDSYMNDIEDLKQILQSIKNQHLSEDETRTQVSKLLETYLEKINIQKVLDDIHLLSPEYMIINDKGNIHIFKHEEIFKNFYQPNSTFYIKKTARSKTSAQIWCKLNDQDFNTNLRMRLILNNGINAFMGKSLHNKSSIPTIKIQQDNVKKVLSVITKLIL
jgi:hypothetical protein